MNMAPATKCAVVKVNDFALASRLETTIICTLRLFSRPNFMRSQNLGAYLNQPDGIPALIPQAKRLLELRRILAELLPESLVRSCSIANCKQGKIIIFATHSAAAAKLKLMRPALSEQLLKRGVQVTGIEVQVQPLGPSAEAIEKSAKLSHNAKENLTRLEAQLPDSELKNAVARMTRRGTRSP